MSEQQHHEFGNIIFKPGEAVEDFAFHINKLASQLYILNDDVSDKEVIKKLLHVVPKKLEQVAISIDTLLDLDSLLIEYVVGHLCVIVQQKKPTPSQDSNAYLLLTEEEWTMACMKNCEGNRSNALLD
jgi:hypothetical protein